MTIHELTSQFGWEGDEGLGERLIEQIIKGIKTATAAPKSFYSESELDALMSQIGKPITVIDKDRRPRCNVWMLEIFETTFGDPDPKLIKGEGLKSAEEFRLVHRLAWDDLGVELTDETVLIAELFRLID